MAADTEVSNMAVDSNGLETAGNQRVLLQELHVKRKHIIQMYNPDQKPEKQSLVLQKQRDDLHDLHCKEEAKRQNTQGQLSERREGERDCPRTPNAVPHGYVDSRKSGTGRFGTVLGLRENDNAVGCDALPTRLAVGDVQPSLCRNESVTSAFFEGGD